ncbi:hypothetical protein EHQ76_16510 [Leptospira barantonii]|uniref:DUF6968 domain-containing protein n=1 Tax=Leptospira barantonii TaxID=2023184 RepID=A0A5F2AZC7_9LEPT|nr:hypothetical protein [Leptospira barantonii]TGL95508.1 hypothetical protein EHQ76_16510 [Leptospira barantonii]
MKSKYKLEPIIAEREFRIQFGKEKYEITIRIGKPKPHPEPDLDWYCSFQILGIPSERITSKIFTSIGFDAVDAIHQTFVCVGLFLSSYLRRKHPQLKRLSPRDLNFPQVTSLRRIRWDEFLKRFRKRNFTVEWKCGSSDSETWI